MRPWTVHPWVTYRRALIGCLTLSFLILHRRVNWRKPVHDFDTDEEMRGVVHAQIDFRIRLPSQSPSVVDAKALYLCMHRQRWQLQSFNFLQSRSACYATDTLTYTALLWQKEASDKSGISRKLAKCICHFHWCQLSIMMFYPTHLLAGWVFIQKIWPGRRAHWIKCKNINNSDLDGVSLASFCQSRAVYIVSAGMLKMKGLIFWFSFKLVNFICDSDKNSCAAAKIVRSSFVEIR